MHQRQQAWRAIVSPNTSLPRCSQTQLAVQDSFYSSVYSKPHRAHSAFLATPPTSSPVPQHDITATQRSMVNSPDPVQYTLDDGSRDEPGTAAYYKSWVFRQKVHKGTAFVPKQEGETGEDLDDSADKDYIKKPRQTRERESLTMIFSRTSVRRARMQRKASERMQRSNRRMKFMRELEKKMPFFKWD